MWYVVFAAMAVAGGSPAPYIGPMSEPQCRAMAEAYNLASAGVYSTDWRGIVANAGAIECRKASAMTAVTCGTGTGFLYPVFDGATARSK